MEIKIKRSISRLDNLVEVEACRLIDCNGKIKKYKLGEIYEFDIKNFTTLGKEYVSYVTKDLGITTSGMEAKLKILYEIPPRFLPSKIKVKLKRILKDKSGNFFLKAYFIQYIPLQY